MKSHMSRGGLGAVPWEDVTKTWKRFCVGKVDKRTYWGDISYSVLPLGVYALKATVWKPVFFFSFHLFDIVHFD